jgi:ComF family protein
MAAVQSRAVTRTGAGLLDLIYPRRCVLCHRLVGPEGSRLCPACVGGLPEPISGARRGSHYSRWVSALWYEASARESILRYKFRGCRFYAGIYGPLLARAVTQQLGTDFDLLTYVPLSPLRRWRRGYDQTLLLARAAGTVLGMEPVRTLKKSSRIRPQSRMLRREDRAGNIRGAFTPVDPALVRGKRVLLIDDILTTGATLSEASRVLRDAGAKEILAATLAVTPK